MKLNHIDLQVPDVQAAARFFERYFGFVLHTSRSSPAIAVLDDGDGFVLVLQRRREGERYPTDFHVGFLVDRAETVIEMQRRMRDDGIEISDVETSSRGTMTYCHAPGDITVEVSCRK